MIETIDVWFNETNGSQREHLPNVLDEVPLSESIKLMGTGEIIPSEPQAEEELIIAPSQPEENTHPKVNTKAEDTARAKSSSSSSPYCK